MNSDITIMKVSLSDSHELLDVKPLITPRSELIISFLHDNIFKYSKHYYCSNSNQKQKTVYSMQFTLQRGYCQHSHISSISQSDL